MYFTNKKDENLLITFPDISGYNCLLLSSFSNQCPSPFEVENNFGLIQWTSSQQVTSASLCQLRIHQTNGIINTYMRSLWWSSWCCGGIRQALKTITFLPKLSSPRHTQRVVHENWSFSPQENVFLCCCVFIMLQALLWLEQVLNCKIEEIVRG